MQNILNKEDIRHILEISKIITRPVFDSEIGANIIFDVSTEFTLLDYDIRNIIDFIRIHHRVICILRDILTAIDQSIVSQFQQRDVYEHIFTLQRSLTALKQPGIKEIGGGDCQEEYVAYGFEKHKYHSEYVVMQNKRIAKMVKTIGEVMDTIPQQNEQRRKAEQECFGCRECNEAQQQEEHHDT